MPFCVFFLSPSTMSCTVVLLSGSAANSRSSTQMNSYSDSGYQEVSGYYSNLVTPRRSEGRSQSTSSAPSFSPSLAMGSRAEGQALAQVCKWPKWRRVTFCMLLYKRKDELILFDCIIKHKSQSGPSMQIRTGYKILRLHRINNHVQRFVGFT